MVFTSVSILSPLPGKASLALARAKRLAEVAGQIPGARTRLSRVTQGDRVRNLLLSFTAETMQALSEWGMKLQTHLDYAKLMEDVDREPASQTEGPETWRTVFGQPKPDYPVILHRDYRLDRRHIKTAVELIGEIQALEPARPILALLPVVSADMERLVFAYYFKSPSDLGEYVDRIGMSPAFQNIVLRAHELGALKRSRVVVDI